MLKRHLSFLFDYGVSTTALRWISVLPASQGCQEINPLAAEQSHLIFLFGIALNESYSWYIDFLMTKIQSLYSTDDIFLHLFMVKMLQDYGRMK